MGSPLPSPLSPPWRVVALALLMVLGFTAVIHLGPLLRMPADHVYLGYTQRDQITYYANAREIVERGNWIFYSNPYTHEPDSPAHYTHLGIAISAFLWRAGVPFIVIDQIFRIAFGSAFLVLWWGLARVFFRSRRLRIAATAIGWTGAGLAWIAALWHLDIGETYRDAFHFAEHSFGWWFYCLFRNLMYATECFYHALAFATLLLIVRGRLGWGAVALFFTWWAHPFTGLEVGGIVGLYLLISALLERRRALWLALAVTSAISGAFLLHMAVIVGPDPEHHSVVEQFEALSTSVYWGEIFKAHGLWIALALPWLLSRGAWRWIVRARAGRLWVAWLVTVALLMVNDRIPFNPQPLQASHFTRGYLYLPLMVAGLKGVAHLFRRFAHGEARRTPPWALVALALLVLPDNVLFMENYVRVQHRESLVTVVPRDSWEIVELMREMPGRHRLAVMERSPSYGIDYLVPSFTPHDTAVGHHVNSPFARQKMHRVIDAWLSGNLTGLRDVGVDIIVTPERGLPPVFGGVPSEEIFANASWRVTRLPE